MTADDLEELIVLAEAAAPSDDAAALVLADRLSALGDPRGELIVLDALDRAGRLDRPDQLERLLLLAAEYTFPRREPEPPPLRWERVSAGAAITYRVFDTAAIVTFDFHGFDLQFEVAGTGVSLHDPPDVDGCGPWALEETAPALSGWLPGLDHDDRWTEALATRCLATLADWVRHRVPACALWLPIETRSDEPAPELDGGPVRIAHVPARFRQPRGIPYDRYALAGRDYHRWISTYRRLEAM